MNFPKRYLSKFAVRRSPFSLIRAPALPPGVLAVAAAFPHFNHADAGAGDSAVACAAPVKPRPLFLRLALNIPRLPRCPKYRAISLNDLNSARARLKPEPVAAFMRARGRAAFAWRPGLFRQPGGGAASRQRSRIYARWHRFSGASIA